MAQTRLAIVQQTARQRPINTARQYGPKQLEFIQFCREFYGHEEVPHTVTSAKLVLFITAKVENRPRRTSGRRARNLDTQEAAGNDDADEPDGGDEDEAAAAADGESPPPIRAGTVEGYVSAVVSLWNEQQACGTNSHPNPRDDNVKNLLKNLRNQENARREAALEDPAAGTLSDGITTIERLSRVVRSLFKLKRGRVNVHALRDRAMYTMLHHGLLRFGNAKMMRLSHLFSVKLPYHGYGGDCLGLMAIIREGKTNRTGRKDLTGMVRNKSVEVCPVGALALYLFERFQLNGAPIPDLRDRETWYRMMLFVEGGNTPVQYTTFYAHLNAAFADAGIISSKVTHAGRASGALMAQLHGAAIDSIRSHGGWNNSALDQSYLTEIPKDSMLAVAGFSPRTESYSIDRDEIDVPEELIAMVFPFAVQLQAGGPYTDVASQNIVDIFLNMRKVVVQDLALLLQLFTHKRHPLATCALARSSEFLEYRSRLLEHIKNGVSHADQSIARSQPLVAAQLQSMNQQIANLGRRIDQMLTLTANNAQQIEQMRSTVTQNVRVAREALDRLDIPAREIQEGIALPVSAQEQPLQARPPQAPMAASFQMSRTISTVVQAFNEWHYGINGEMSVALADQRHGSAWRLDANERKHYSRRKMLMKAISDYAERHQTTETLAAEQLEALRMRSPCKALSTFSEALHHQKIQF